MPLRHLRLVLSALVVAVPLQGQTAHWVPYFGGGLVVQRRTVNGLETAVGPTVLAGVARRLTPALRARIDLRYSFDQSLGSAATAPCPGPCPPDGLVASGVLSLATGLELFPQGAGKGFFLRLAGGLHHFSGTASGASGLLPSLGGGLGWRFPHGPRGAFLLEARVDRLFGVDRGPRELWPALLTVEL
jgi:hypothetical protein